MTNWLIRVGFCLLVLPLVLGTAAAQNDRATLTGTVTDPTLKAIGAARVTVLALATGIEHVIATNHTGSFAVASLPIGDYTVTVSSEGFRTLRFEKAGVDIGQVLTLNATLDVQGAKSEISVTESVPDLDRNSASIGSVITGSQMRDLPLNGRSWVRLLTLVPGAIDAASGTQDQVRFAGLSREDNNVHIDGVKTARGTSGLARRAAASIAFLIERSLLLAIVMNPATRIA